MKEVKELMATDDISAQQKDSEKEMLAKELPMEDLLEMIKDPETENNVLEVAVEKLEEAIAEAPTDIKTVDANVVEDIAEMPLENILDLAKSPAADSQVLEMAVEKIKETQAVNEMSDSNKKLAEALPMDILLEMAKDPEAKDEILETAVERLEDALDQTPAIDNTIASAEIAEMSKLPLETIIDMAKEPEANEVVLEMAVKKIKEAQQENEISEYAPPSESLGKTLPMEILLEMAKDPNVKEQILEMAMERLKELNEVPRRW